eukprot:COSAG03_NODE_10331_length_657_cov_0.853047_1_plen_61_part_00
MIPHHPLGRGGAAAAAERVLLCHRGRVPVALQLGTLQPRNNFKYHDGGGGDLTTDKTVLQ